MIYIIQFVDLHNTLKDEYQLPPKRILTTIFVPSAWIDDKLIAERKAGLTTYLSNILSNAEYRKNAAVKEFLTSSSPTTSAVSFDLEDALPSTLSRAKALQLKAEALKGTVETQAANATLIAASYYPGWQSLRLV